jgi:hypothetical protein
MAGGLWLEVQLLTKRDRDTTLPVPATEFSLNACDDDDGGEGGGGSRAQTASVAGRACTVASLRSGEM